MTCVNYKRLAKTAKQIAAALTDKHRAMFALSASAGIMASTASDDWTHAKHTFFLQLMRIIQIKPLANGGKNTACAPLCRHLQRYLRFSNTYVSPGFFPLSPTSLLVASNATKTTTQATTGQKRLHTLSLALRCASTLKIVKFS